MPLTRVVRVLEYVGEADQVTWHLTHAIQERRVCPNDVWVRVITREDYPELQEALEEIEAVLAKEDENAP